MLNRIIEYFKPFTHDVNHFVLKNEPTWYSSKYRNILYSGNGGRTFKKLLCANGPLFTHGDTILEYNWSFEEFTFDCERESFSKYINKIKCLQDIIDYEKEQYEIFKNGLLDVKEKRRMYLDRINNNIKGV